MHIFGDQTQWMLKNIPGAAERAAAGELAFGTVDNWLIWNLTGELHVTDVSNASRTMLFNIHTLRWDDELLELFGIPKSASSCTLVGLYRHLPHPSISVRRSKLPGCGRPAGRSVRPDLFEPGDVKNTYGTGAFLLMNTGKEAPFSRSGLLTTWSHGAAASLSDTLYALEGSVLSPVQSCSGCATSWEAISTATESEALAMSVDHTCGCYIVPAFTGLGAPWWDGSARGIITGLTRGVNRRHIVRAALESAYQVADVLHAMAADTGRNLKAIYVDGGASTNNFCFNSRQIYSACPFCALHISSQQHLARHISQDSARAFGIASMRFRRSPVTFQHLSLKCRQTGASCFRAGMRLFPAP